MNELFVPYPLAIQLKEIGFDESCFSGYRNEDGEEMLLPIGKWRNSEHTGFTDDWASAPLYDQVIQWFIDNHRIKIALLPFTSGKDSWWIWTWDNTRWVDLGKRFETRDLAIEKVIELIKNEKS